MKHNYNDDDDFYKENRRVNDNKSQSRRKYKTSQIRSARVEKETKEEERVLSMRLIFQEKDPAVGINGFEGIGPEQLMPQQKNFIFPFQKRVRF